jgi:hypothetical protein
MPRADTGSTSLRKRETQGMGIESTPPGICAFYGETSQEVSERKER